MGKRTQIPENERNRAIGKLSAKYRQQDVMRQFNVHSSTISRLLSRFRVTWQARPVNVIDVNRQQWFAKIALSLQRRGAHISCLHPKLPMSCIGLID
jgi:hypothetical protein